MATRPQLEELVALDPGDVRAALLDRGIGLSEPEVAQALELMRQEAVGSTAGGRGRLALGVEGKSLRAGAVAATPVNAAALEYAVDWFAKTFFVAT